MVGERGFEPPTPWSRTVSGKNLGPAKKSWGKRGLESKACKSSSRRRFRKFEDAPVAAYCTATSVSFFLDFQLLASTEYNPVSEWRLRRELLDGEQRTSQDSRSGS